ncbi:kynureninase [Phycomyces blakesleeanus]
MMSAKTNDLSPTSLEYAQLLDSQDTLARFRKEFNIPTRRDVLSPDLTADNEKELDLPCTYLCGNSLGLMPELARKRVIEELDVWSKRGVEGHWNHPHNRPWVTIDEIVKEPLARIVGAKPIEVTPMNTLTSNLHSMMITFYQPTKSRFKILIEEKAFPSDHYAVSSHIQSRGIDPEVGLLTVGPRPRESTLRTEDIIKTIRNDKSIALVLLSGVQYYTGQLFEIEKITKAGHEEGCMVGWDLAHAVGNVPLQLHDWQVDFACWCSYKYLNSGPGGIGGLFVHEKYANDTSRPRLAGWWGNDKENRFEMKPEFSPSKGAAGYQVSNPGVLVTSALAGSLEIFDQAGFTNLRNKSVRLTSFLETLLVTILATHLRAGHFKILTPTDVSQRGCQLSLDFPERMIEVFEELQKRGIICDERKPTVIRIAPTPLYNSFEDVHRVVYSLGLILDRIYPTKS